MDQRRVLLLATALIVAVIACKPSDTRVLGDVFIVTKGGQNYKLGLVEVRFVPEAAIAPVIARKIKEAGPALSQLKQEVERKQRFADAMRKMGEVGDVTHVAKENMELAARLGPAEYRKAKADYERVLQVRQQGLQGDIGRLQDIKADLEEIRQYETGCVFARDLPPASQVGKTDADGKFEVTLPAGKYAAVATSSREHAGSVENYCWLVWVTAAGEAEKRIMLSNDNLAATSCADCVVPIERLSAKPAQ